jgi:hypothetical protein
MVDASNLLSALNSFYCFTLTDTKHQFLPNLLKKDVLIQSHIEFFVCLFLFFYIVIPNEYNFYEIGYIYVFNCSHSLLHCSLCQYEVIVFAS